MLIRLISLPESNFMIGSNCSIELDNYFCAANSTSQPKRSFCANENCPRIIIFIYITESSRQHLDHYNITIAYYAFIRTVILEKGSQYFNFHHSKQTTNNSKKLITFYIQIRVTR